MHNRHVWTVRTNEGANREVRVIKVGGSWRFQSRCADQERWTYYEEAPLADLEEFREILFRKYQRRRAAYEDVLWATQELVRRRELLRGLNR